MKDTRFPASHAVRPVEAGMVISVETTIPNPSGDFTKLEDAMAVTAEGHEMFGQRCRGWSRGGMA